MVPPASAIPGFELVEAGLRDLVEGHCSVPALVVSIGAPRLRQLGFEVTHPIADPDHALYRLLAAEDPDSAHGPWWPGGCGRHSGSSVILARLTARVGRRQFGDR